MLTRFHRLGLGAAASFAAALCVPGVAAAETPGAQSLGGSGWTANEDDFLFLQLTIERYKLNYDVRGYQTDRGVCLDLADVIQSLDLPVRLDKKSRRATGWLFAEDQTFTIDREANTVQNVNSGAAPLGSDIYDTPEGWCVDTKALSRWFGMTFKPDLFNSIVRLESDKDLPFMQAIERKSRAARLRGKREPFDLSKFPHADMEYKPWRAPSVDVLSRTAVRTGAGAQTKVSSRVELFASGEALGASYNMRVSTDDSMVPQSLRVKAYRYDHEGGLLGPLKATQVAAGDVQLLAGELTGQNSVGRGAFVSNQPIGRPSRFSAVTLRGVLPSGWDAELYRNGQLLAYQEDSGDGRYEFVDVDLYFGRNELEVVLYGPQGQIRREKADYPVGVGNIEPGKTHYWAGILQRDRDLIELRREVGDVGPHEWRWGVGVEHGLDKRTSISLGLQSLQYLGQRRRYAEGAISRSFGSWLGRLSGAYEWGAGTVVQANLAGRLGGINVNTYALKTFGNFSSEFAGTGIDYRAGLQFDSSLKLGRMALPLQGSIAHTRRKDGGKLTEASLTTSVVAGPVAISAQLEHQISTGLASGVDSRRTRARILANTRLKGLRLRGSASFDLAGYVKGLDTVRVTAEKNLDENSDLYGELEYLAKAEDTRFSLGYSRRFEKFALRGDASYTTNGAFGANLSLTFSIGPDPARGGVRFSENKLARYGQAAVTVFRDDDGDGLLGDGEELLKDVGVEAGLRRTDAITAENGVAIVDELQPFKPILVGIDETTLGDPFLAASSKGVVVVPRPGVAAEVRIPVTASGEVEGTLLGLSGLELPGVVLQLVDRRGNVAAEAMTEFDGFFLFQRVPYGEYRLRVEGAAAKKLHVDGQLAGAVVIARGKDVARLGAIKLRGSKPVIASTVQGGAGAPITAGGAQSP